MKKLITICSLFVFSFSLLAQDSVLVSYRLVKQHNKETLKAMWKKNKLPQLFVPIKFDVDIYEITYKGRWIDGSMRTATGIYYTPKSTPKALPTMVFAHGTEIFKGREISDDDAQQGICLGSATGGYNVLYPDYFGIGGGEGNHLYQHAESEASAIIYMLYAVKELNRTLGIRTNEQLFLTGYSQGAHASFAAAKALEKRNDPCLTVTACSPMSGAYDMTGEQTKFMFQVYPRPFYLPYLLVSYQEAYHVLDIDNIYDVFVAPFDSILPYYFEGERTHKLMELNKTLPQIPKDVIKKEFVDMFLSDPNFPFTTKLVENNLYDWLPKAPVQLCYCKGDREVSFKNSEKVFEEMTSKGKTDIKLNNLSNKLDHNTCALFAVMATKYFFDRYKTKGRNPKMKDVPPFKKMLLGFLKKKIEKKYLENKRDKAYM